MFKIMTQKSILASLLMAAGAMFASCSNELEEPQIDAQPEAI